MKLIIPFYYWRNFSLPVIYLDGPIKDALDWRADVIKFFLKEHNNAVLVSPQTNFNEFNEINSVIVREGEYRFGQQQWVKYHLKQCSNKGAVLIGNAGINLEETCENSFKIAVEKLKPI